MASREEYVNEMEQRLRQAESRIVTYEGNVNRRITELKNTQERIRREFREAQQRLERVKSAPDENWETPKQDFERELTELDTFTETVVKNIGEQ